MSCNYTPSMQDHCWIDMTLDISPRVPPQSGIDNNTPRLIRSNAAPPSACLSFHSFAQQGIDKVALLKNPLCTLSDEKGTLPNIPINTYKSALTCTVYFVIYVCDSQWIVGDAGLYQEVTFHTKHYFKMKDWAVVNSLLIEKPVL